MRCRITFNKARYEFATGLFVYPDSWNSVLQQLTPANQENTYINTELSLMKNNISQAFLLLKIQKSSFNVEDIYLAFKGENIKTEKTILEVFELHNSKMHKLIGKSYTQATYYKFKETKNHVKNFIKHEYNRKDYLLNNLNLNFLEKFDFYLNSEVKQKQITINKTIQRLRKIIKLAISEDYITKDPFMLYTPKKVKNQIVFLTHDELKKLREFEFKQNERLQKVKDCFIFCCYTGLAFSEMENLKREHLVKEFDGNIWIKMVRKKTNGNVSVPLLTPAKEILSKYSNDEKILPVISNQKFNDYVKTLCEKAEINEMVEVVKYDKGRKVYEALPKYKLISSHTGRRTFITNSILAGIPLSIIQSISGHKKLVTIQKYVKLSEMDSQTELSKLVEYFNQEE